LTTPTGAAIVAALVDEFGPLPAMTIDRIGLGAGQKDFPHPNILRLIVGAAATAAGGAGVLSTAVADSIVHVETNLDDVAGESLGFAIEQLWAAGALDVSTAALSMKKNRPGVLLAVQCRPADADEITGVLFRHTTALGVRRSTVSRVTLPRRSAMVETPYGTIAGVVATLPDGTRRFSPEYEACAAAARQHGAPLETIQHAARQAAQSIKEER
jgi:uncharacterized protein (DUF111 family)